MQTGPAVVSAATRRRSPQFTHCCQLTLGIHIKCAIQWQQLSSGDWAAYAAEVGQRNAEPDTAFQQFE
ncbi:hypothetical protein ABIA39_008867 [Nocardia sp. GAS34]